MSKVTIKDADNNTYETDLKIIRGEICVTWDGDTLRLDKEDIAYIKLR